MAIAALDIKTAFLYTMFCDEEDGILLARPPHILEKFGLIQPDRFWKLNKALYELRSAPKKWGEQRYRSLSGKQVMPINEDGQIQGIKVAEVIQCTSCKSLWAILLNDKSMLGTF